MIIYIRRNKQHYLTQEPFTEEVRFQISLKTLNCRTILKPSLPLESSIDTQMPFWIHIFQVSLVEPLVSLILLTLELSVTHTTQPIRKDTPAPSHAMLYTYIAAAYTQSSCQLATSTTPSRHVTYNHDLAASPELQYVQLSFEPLAIQKPYMYGVDTIMTLDAASGTEVLVNSHHVLETLFYWIMNHNIRNTFGTNLPVDFLSFLVLCTYIYVYVSYVL